VEVLWFLTLTGRGKRPILLRNGTGLEDLVTTGLIAPSGIALDVQDLPITYSSGPMGGAWQRYGIALATTK
jgi:hypothetical protein